MKLHCAISASFLGVSISLETGKIEWESMYVWENNLEINLPVGKKVRLLMVVMELAEKWLNRSPWLSGDYIDSGEIHDGLEECKRLCY